MKIEAAVLAIYCLIAAPSLAEDAATWLDRSIAYHDPTGLWGETAFALEITETRPDGPYRRTRLEMGPGGDDFSWLAERDGHRLEGELTSTGCELRLDGSNEISAEDRAAFRLTCDRLRWIRNYYVYLWGLPMKLKDPGTRLDPVAERTELDGRPVVTLRVTYDEEVGGDVWYFHLDPETAALVAYRFYHDESKHDGESIELEGETEGAGLRLPRARTWTTHAEGKLLGTDTLVRLERVEER